MNNLVFILLFEQSAAFARLALCRTPEYRTFAFLPLTSYLKSHQYTWVLRKSCDEEKLNRKNKGGRVKGSPLYSHTHRELFHSSCWCDLHSFRVASGFGDSAQQELHFVQTRFYINPHICCTVHNWGKGRGQRTAPRPPSS